MHPTSSISLTLTNTSCGTRDVALGPEEVRALCVHCGLENTGREISGYDMFVESTHSTFIEYWL